MNNSFHIKKSELTRHKGQLTLPFIKANELTTTNKERLNTQIATTITKITNKDDNNENA